MREVVHRSAVSEVRAADSLAGNVSAGKADKEALAQRGLCRPGVRRPSRLMPATSKGEVSGILRAWSLS